MVHPSARGRTLAAHAARGRASPAAVLLSLPVAVLLAAQLQMHAAAAIGGRAQLKEGTELVTEEAAGSLCGHTVDQGAVRGGDDFSCEASAASLGDCVAACCASARCRSFSFNEPWGLNASYMGCVKGKNCCCLKDGAPPLEPNTWPCPRRRTSLPAHFRARSAVAPAG